MWTARPIIKSVTWELTVEALRETARVNKTDPLRLVMGGEVEMRETEGGTVDHVMHSSEGSVDMAMTVAIHTSSPLIQQ